MYFYNLQNYSKDQSSVVSTDRAINNRAVNQLAIDNLHTKMDNMSDTLNNFIAKKEDECDAQRYLRDMNAYTSDVWGPRNLNQEKGN